MHDAPFTRGMGGYQQKKNGIFIMPQKKPLCFAHHFPVSGSEWGKGRRFFLHFLAF